jgi:hypothetical protein
MSDARDWTLEGQVMFERSTRYHESSGPYEGGRVGFRIGDRVFWTDAYCFPGDTNDQYAAKVAFAAEIVRRLNNKVTEGSGK